MERKNRQHDRTPVEVEVRVSTIDPEIDAETGHRYFRESEETCATLSPGGAFIRSLDPPAEGRRLVLQIHVPGEGEPIEATGRVAWTQRTLDPTTKTPDAPADIGAGVEFTETDPHARRVLARYLAHRRDGGPNQAGE
jgi:Tfp pilus assembly protein PilZ